MSVEAMTWAFQVPLKPCPKSVLIALSNRADEDGYCWPGIGDLQLRTGWGVRSIQAALKELESSGLLQITPRFLASGTQTSNLYQLVMPTISSGEGAGGAGGRVQVVRGEGAGGAGGRVQVVRGEGAGGAPKYSSEQSIEQSIEERTPSNPPTRGVGVVSAVDREFEEFWAAYPKKVGKIAAWRAWKKIRERPDLQDVLLAIDQATRSEQWVRGFIPNPATWINQGRWMDQVSSGSTRRRATSVVDWVMLQGGHV